MSNALDLHDIQGNIVFGYGRFGYPKARYVFFKFNDGAKARTFVSSLVPLVTTSAPLDKQQTDLKKPDATTNVAFTYSGLRELGIPDASLRTFPADFRMGMRDRVEILGDDGPSSPEHWDSIWRDNVWSVHMWLSINGVSEAEVEARYQQIIALRDEANGGANENEAVQLLIGHHGANGAKDLPYQSASAIYSEVDIGGQKVPVPTPKEHFGYTDGISDPFFKGMENNAQTVIGGGKPTRGNPQSESGWQALGSGEFVLGHRDETNEYPKAPEPKLLSTNGSFMVYRKLHENVGAFTNYIREASKDMPGISNGLEAFETLAAKFAGRWSNGASLANYPTWEEAQEFGKQWDGCVYKLFINPQAFSEEERAEAKALYTKLKLSRVAFKYDDDISGAKCPVTSHMRRVNPRGALEFGNEGAFDTPGALVDRRRILRRGLPYGDSTDRDSNDGDHGIVFMAINASIERQFEFVQQQWVNYGNDFKLGNDKDPLLGNHQTDADGNPKGRAIIDGDERTGKRPFFCANMPRFVETRGGDYFFIPSMTALRMIGEGIVDPT